MCYLLVYGVAPVSLALLFLNHQRDHVSRFGWRISVELWELTPVSVLSI